MINIYLFWQVWVRVSSNVESSSTLPPRRDRKKGAVFERNKEIQLAREKAPKALALNIRRWAPLNVTSFYQRNSPAIFHVGP